MADGDGMQRTAEDGTPITPYNRAGLATALRPDRPAPVTPMQEVPGVSIVSKRMDKQGNLYAKLTDGSEKKLDRQTFKAHPAATPTGPAPSENLKTHPAALTAMRGGT